jgi:hypothetical protein
MSYDDEGGEPPSKVLFANHQWSVTDYGVEAVRPDAPYYHFGADRILETTDRGGQLFYDWPIHLGEKTWVDIEAFIEVFLKAIEMHAGRLGGKVDQDVLARSLARGRKEASRR